MGEGQTAEELAHERARYLTGLLWHVGTFVIINAFFWGMDLAVGQAGLQWAYLITAVWGFALAFHALAYLIDGRQVEERKTEEYLERDGRHPTRP
jgi:2TM domain